MGDHYDELVVGYLLKDIHYLHGSIGIQCAGRLVGKKDVRVVDQGAGYGNTLHLAAGHLVGLFVELVAQTYLFKRILGSSPALRAGNTGEGQGKLNIGQNTLVRDKVVGLENKADGVVSVYVPIPVLKGFGGASVYHKVTGGILVKTADYVQKSGLTAAGVAKNGYKLVLAKLQTYPLEGVHKRITGNIVFFDIL